MSAQIYTSFNTRSALLVLVLSVATAMSMQKVEPAFLFVLCLLPWLILSVYYRPFLLVILWHVLLVPTLILPYLGFQVGGIWFIPMDPVYSLGLAYLGVLSLTQPRDFFKTVKENPFLTILLIIVILSIVIYTPIYGKKAIGEARKFYFFFFFPLLTVTIIKTHLNLHRLLLCTVLLAIILLMDSLLRLASGSSLRSLASAQSSLVFLLVLFSIAVCYINKIAITNRILDFSIFALCLIMLILTQHRSVILAGVFGLALIFYLYRNRSTVVMNLGLTITALFVVIILIIFSVPSFEDRTTHYLSGIINPTKDMTASWRIEGWRQQLNGLSRGEWLFGKGMGSYFIWFHKGTEVMVEPHNGYVQLVLKFGLLGLTIYILLVVRFFGKVMASRKKLPPGATRAFLDVSILNFAASHAFLMGYGFTPIILIFYAMGMGAVRLAGTSGEATVLHRYDTLDSPQGLRMAGFQQQ